MEIISRILLTFLLNSLWQVPIAAAVAALACRAMRNAPARHRHAVWAAALVAALLVPLASVRRGDDAPTPQFDPALAQPRALPGVAVRHLPAQAPTAPVERAVSVAGTTAAAVLAAYLLFVLYRLALLARSALRTAQICREARALAIPDALRRVTLRCQDAYGIDGTELLFSPALSGPVTAGRAIILPESLLSGASEEVLTTAIGHEMAHIARRDFAWNVFYEALLLPLSFHPAAWAIGRGIERTREMACDELVTARLMDARVYARSIVGIAAGMPALPSPGYTLGVFDGDILEERVRRLLESPAASVRRARLLLAAGLSALAVCAAVASSLALTARAQGSASAAMQQADDALKSGDTQRAIALLETAVQLEPSNVKARLSLANALLTAYVPGGDPNSPLVTRARRQYMDVLSRDSRNKQALQGMMILATNTKQFAEAHDWAIKAIQADPTDKAAYYTAAFVDWATTYPDYATARAAAGMKPWDTGIIPDAGLRNKVRAEHGAQIQDGFTMLQTALQLDPEYSDAMAYMNLLYRIQAGISDTDAQYADLTAKADEWVDKALAAKRAQAGKPQPPNGSYMVPAPPPPPPPPPPAADANVPASAVRAEASDQAKKLVSQVAPVYPQQARDAGISGQVQLRVVVGKNGTVQDIHVLSGHPLLVPAAIEAVRQWVYQPTLVNGQPVEVVSTVNVNFALRQ